MARTRSWVVVVVLVSIFLFSVYPSVAEAAEKKSFSATDFFTGDWQFSRSRISTSTGAVIGRTVRGAFNLKETADGILSGKYYENSTGFGEYPINQVVLQIEFSSGTSGVFKIARDSAISPGDDAEFDAPDHSTPLLTVDWEKDDASQDGGDDDEFERGATEQGAATSRTLFEFVLEPPAPNGVMAAHDQWLGRPRGLYQLLILSPVAFTLTVYPQSSVAGRGQDHEISVLHARKAAPQEPGFLKKYGMSMLMFFVFAVSKLYRANKSVQSAATRRRPAGPQPKAD